MFYKEVRQLGAVYAELQEPSKGHKFFEVDRDDGEIFIWIGRLHLILTPWSRLIAGLAALFGGLFFSPGPAVHTAAAAVLTLVAVTEVPKQVVATDQGVPDQMVPVVEVVKEWQDVQWSCREASEGEDRPSSSTSL